MRAVVLGSRMRMKTAANLRGVFYKVNFPAKSSIWSNAEVISQN